MSPHRTNNQDSDDLLRRFREALQTVDLSPSDEAVGELRSAAAPLHRQAPSGVSGCQTYG
jgi:hypothetical protein